MAATVQAQFANGATPTLANAETGIKWNRDDTQTGTSAPIPIPTATGTNFSALKYLALVVTATSTTNMSNRRVAWATAPATGINGWFFSQGTYTQNTLTQGTAAGNFPANDTTKNGANPGLAPTATLNGAQSTGTTVTVNSGGASFTSGMNIVIGLGTANAEARIVTGTSTATAITITVAMAAAHANADTVAQAYVNITTSNTVYDSSSVATSSAARNGNYIQCVLGVDNSYTGGAGTNQTVPTLNMVYDEA